MFHLQALMQRVTPQRTGPVTSLLQLLCGFKTFQGMILIVLLTSYNVFTETCGELVFINWSEVLLYRADLNGSSLTCYVHTGDKTVTSEKINLTFLEQQMQT